MITLYDAFGHPIKSQQIPMGVPALTLGTVNAPGVSPNFLADDSTINVFDGGLPTSRSWSDVAALGSAAFFARRDHVHGMPPGPTSQMWNPKSWLGAANLTTNTAFVSNTTYFIYMGYSATNTVIGGFSFNGVNFFCTVAGVTITWAELAIYTGTPVANGGTTLTLWQGGGTPSVLDISTLINTTGHKATAISFGGFLPVGHYWLALGSQATTPFQIRGGDAYETQDGGFLSLAGFRPSTGTTTPSPGLAAAALPVPWVVIGAAI